MKKYLIFLFAMTMGLAGLSSCSEEDATENEFDNWQERNETFLVSLQDSLSAGGTQWKRFRNFSLDQQVEGQPADYIYVKVLADGGDATGESPVYTDSVRVSYEGRLIPSKTYPDGYVFDTTFYGEYSLGTTSTAKLLMSSVVDGFATALQHMRRGDRWRVYIPYNLGYGTAAQSSIPAYSTLIFDITLIDFSHAGEVMQVWSSRRAEAE